jgi:hypothetical protein
MKKLLATAILVCCNLYVSAQTTFSYSTGIATYNLADLKDLQAEYVRNIPEIPVKAVTTFPSYLYFKGQLESLVSPSLFVGVSAGFYSTGARNHLADYTGEYSLTMPLRSFRVGIHAKIRNVLSTEKKKLSIGPKFEIGLRNTKLEKKELFTAYEVFLYKDSMAYYSKNFYIEPSVECQVVLFRNITGLISVGWEQNIENKLFLKGGNGEWMKNQSGNAVFLNMSGLRFAVCLQYVFLPRFPGKKKE